MEAPKRLEAPAPEIVEAAALEQRVALEDAYEELLLCIWALEEDWRLDDRIAFSLRARK